MCVFCVFFHSHEKDTTLPRQKRKPATHRTPHCHVRKEPLPRTGDHTATSERNYCHIRQIEKKKNTRKKHKKHQKNKTKKNTHKKKTKQNPKKHLKHLKCTWQKNSGIGECQILRVGPFFMVEEPANSISMSSCMSKTGATLPGSIRMTHIVPCYSLQILNISQVLPSGIDSHS